MRKNYRVLFELFSFNIWHNFVERPQHRNSAYIVAYLKDQIMFFCIWFRFQKCSSTSQFLATVRQSCIRQQVDKHVEI